MHVNASKLVAVVASLGVAGACALMIGAGQSTQETTQESTQTAEAESQEAPKTPSMVATFDPQAVFLQSQRSTRLNEKMTEFQTRMSQAQQQGDQQGMMQVQMEAEQFRTSEIEAFLAEIDDALPGVAREAGIKIVAVEYAWVDDTLGQPADLTEALSEKID